MPTFDVLRGSELGGSSSLAPAAKALLVNSRGSRIEAFLIQDNDNSTLEHVADWEIDGSVLSLALLATTRGVLIATCSTAGVGWSWIEYSTWTISRTDFFELSCSHGLTATPPTIGSLAFLRHSRVAVISFEGQVLLSSEVFKFGDDVSVRGPLIVQAEMGVNLAGLIKDAGSNVAILESLAISHLDSSVAMVCRDKLSNGKFLRWCEIATPSTNLSMSIASQSVSGSGMAAAIAAKSQQQLPVVNVIWELILPQDAVVTSEPYNNDGQDSRKLIYVCSSSFKSTSGPCIRLFNVNGPVCEVTFDWLKSTALQTKLLGGVSSMTVLALPESDECSRRLLLSMTAGLYLEVLISDVSAAGPNCVRARKASAIAERVVKAAHRINNDIISPYLPCCQMLLQVSPSPVPRLFGSEVDIDQDDSSMTLLGFHTKFGMQLLRSHRGRTLGPKFRIQSSEPEIHNLSILNQVYFAPYECSSFTVLDAFANVGKLLPVPAPPSSSSSASEGRPERLLAICGDDSLPWGGGIVYRCDLGAALAYHSRYQIDLSGGERKMSNAFNLITMQMPTNSQFLPEFLPVILTSRALSLSALIVFSSEGLVESPDYLIAETESTTIALVRVHPDIAVQILPAGIALIALSEGALNGQLSGRLVPIQDMGAVEPSWRIQHAAAAGAFILLGGENDLAIVRVSVDTSEMRGQWSVSLRIQSKQALAAGIAAISAVQHRGKCYAAVSLWETCETLIYALEDTGSLSQLCVISQPEDVGPLRQLQLVSIAASSLLHVVGVRRSATEREADCAWIHPLSFSGAEAAPITKPPPATKQLQPKNAPVRAKSKAPRRQDSDDDEEDEEEEGDEENGEEGDGEGDGDEEEEEEGEEEEEAATAAPDREAGVTNQGPLPSGSLMIGEGRCIEMPGNVLGVSLVSGVHLTWPPPRPPPTPTPTHTLAKPPSDVAVDIDALAAGETKEEKGLEREKEKEEAAENGDEADEGEGEGDEDKEEEDEEDEEGAGEKPRAKSMSAAEMMKQKAKAMKGSDDEDEDADEEDEGEGEDEEKGEGEEEAAEEEEGEGEEDEDEEDEDEEGKEGRGEDEEEGPKMAAMDDSDDEPEEAGEEEKEDGDGEEGDEEHKDGELGADTSTEKLPKHQQQVEVDWAALLIVTSDGDLLLHCDKVCQWTRTPVVRPISNTRTVAVQLPRVLLPDGTAVDAFSVSTAANQTKRILLPAALLPSLTFAWLEATPLLDAMRPGKRQGVELSLCLGAVQSPVRFQPRVRATLPGVICDAVTMGSGTRARCVLAWRQSGERLGQGICIIDHVSLGCLWKTTLSPLRSALPLSISIALAPPSSSYKAASFRDSFAILYQNQIVSAASCGGVTVSAYSYNPPDSRVSIHEPSVIALGSFEFSSGAAAAAVGVSEKGTQVKRIVRAAVGPHYLAVIVDSRLSLLGWHQQEGAQSPPLQLTELCFLDHTWGVVIEMVCAFPFPSAQSISLVPSGGGTSATPSDLYKSAARLFVSRAYQGVEVVGFVEDAFGMALMRERFVALPDYLLSHLAISPLTTLGLGQAFELIATEHATSSVIVMSGRPRPGAGLMPSFLPSHTAAVEGLEDIKAFPLVAPVTSHSLRGMYFFADPSSAKISLVDSSLEVAVMGVDDRV